MRVILHRKLAIPLILIFLSLVIATIDFRRGIASPAFTLSFFSPIQQRITTSVQWFLNIRERVFMRFDLVAEREKLIRDIELLQFQVAMLEEVRLENIRLKRLLQFKEREEFSELLGRTVSARVIGRDPVNWYQALFIDRGKDDGVTAGMPVINYEGIVGYISEVGFSTAKVRLILSNDVSVGAIVQRIRAEGVVTGKGGATRLCKMIYLPIDADIREEDIVVSSGVGGKYPSGIRLGSVLSVVKEDYFQRAIIFPAVDFSKLEEVLVLKEK
ncbi:MAG: Cell shape-determining protein MreC [Syntrophomonadaceae bacterium]|nr:Cell shape-determining protein MreC [Bacillota bacterium]